MSKNYEYLERDGDNLYVCRFISHYNNSQENDSDVIERRLILTKAMFQECLNAWSVNQGS